MGRAPPDEAGQVLLNRHLLLPLLHELAESLTVIENYAAGTRRGLRTGAADPVRLAGALERLGNQVRRAADIIGRFRALLDAIDIPRDE